MTVSMSMKDVLQSLRVRANDACARAEAIRSRALEVAAQLSLQHESTQRLRRDIPWEVALAPHAPQPCVPQQSLPDNYSQKVRLVLALHQEQSALSYVDHRVRTQWLLKKGESTPGHPSELH